MAGVEGRNWGVVGYGGLGRKGGGQRERGGGGLADTKKEPYGKREREKKGKRERSVFSREGRDRKARHRNRVDLGMCVDAATVTCHDAEASGSEMD